jgi:hypothetical protein
MEEALPIMARSLVTIIISAVALSTLSRRLRAASYARGYVDGLRGRPPAGPDEMDAMRPSRA